MMSELGAQRRVRLPWAIVVQEGFWEEAGDIKGAWEDACTFLETQRGDPA